MAKKQTIQAQIESCFGMGPENINIFQAGEALKHLARFADAQAKQIATLTKRMSAVEGRAGELDSRTTGLIRFGPTPFDPDRDFDPKRLERVIKSALKRAKKKPEKKK